MSKRLSERAWRSRVRAFERSGLTQVAWCRRHGVPMSSFGRWRARFRKEAEIAQTSALVPIVVREPDPGSTGCSLIVTVGSLRLVANGQLDSNWLVRVLRGLCG